MQYTKPQLISLGSSIAAILTGNCHKSMRLSDNSEGCNPETHITNGAYEADE